MSCSRSRCRGPYGEPTPAAVLRGRRDGVRRERPGRAVCTSPTPRTAQPERGHDPRRRRAARPRAATPAPTGSWSGSAAPAPTTAEPACWPRSAPPPRAARSTRGRPGSPTLTAVDLGRRPRAVRRRRAGDWPATSTTRCSGINGATKIYGPQKGLPDERLVRSSTAGCSSFAELTDRKVAAQKGAGAAGGLGFALMLLGGRRTPGVALVSDAVGLADRPGARPTSW